jgi:integrase
LPTISVVVRKENAGQRIKCPVRVRSESGLRSLRDIQAVHVTSEGPTRITRTTVESAWRRRAPGQRIVVRDEACRGLALVVNQRGMIWRLDYRPRGTDPDTRRRWPMQSLTIGTPESHGPDDARTAAGTLKGQAKAGIDLGEERRTRVAEASRRRATTVDRLLEPYKTALPLRPKLRGTGQMAAKSVKDELAHLRRAVTTMGISDRAVEAVTQADLRKLLVAEASRPATARNQFGAVVRFFDWCIEEGGLKLNPCAVLPKSRRPRVAPSRTNCPGLADLAALWRAAADLASVECDLVRFLIAVPARLREATHLDWSRLDLDAKCWTLPAASTKTRTQHVFYLPAAAMDILRRRHKGAGDPRDGLVFPSTKAAAPIETFTDMKRALMAKSGVRGWTFHDNRRAFASACADAGVAESVADAVLSHRQSATRGGVLGVYQRSTRIPEQRAAMDTWGCLLETAIHGGSSSETILRFGSVPAAKGDS